VYTNGTNGTTLEASFPPQYICEHNLTPQVKHKLCEPLMKLSTFSTKMNLFTYYTAMSFPNHILATGIMVANIFLHMQTFYLCR
jgi:hypothetical protein